MAFVVIHIELNGDNGYTMKNSHIRFVLLGENYLKNIDIGQ